MRACPHCNGTGDVEVPCPDDNPAVPLKCLVAHLGPCPAEHVELIRCPYDPRLCKAHEGHSEPFFADPASVPMWWCRLHECSAPGRNEPCWKEEYVRSGVCVVVPADEPVTYELWKEKTQ